MATGINVDLKHKSNDMFPNITTLYFDMDGVLADFAKGAEEVGAWVKQGDETVLDWEPIYYEGEDFWANLEWTPNGKELFTKVYDYVTSKGCQVCILSAVHYKEGIEGKKTWLKNNLPKGRNHIKAYFTKDGNDKAGYITNVGKYADEDCVLIDDFGKNCRFFREHGGQAIKFSGNVEYVLNELRKMFEWDIHEKYLQYKIQKAMNEVTSNFKDYIDKLSNKLTGYINKKIKEAPDKIKYKYNKSKQEQREANSFKIENLKDNECLKVITSNDEKLYIKVIRGSTYIVFPKMFRKVKVDGEGENIKLSIQYGEKYKVLSEENFGKFLEAYNNKKFFIKCEISTTEEGYLVSIGEETTISIDTSEVPKESKMIYNEIPSDIKFSVSDFDVVNFKELCDNLVKKQDWYKKINEGNEEINNQFGVQNEQELSLDKETRLKFNESYEKLKYAFENLNKFTYVSNGGKNGKKYLITKNDGGYNTIKIGEKERQVILTKEGIVVAIV